MDWYRRHHPIEEAAIIKALETVKLTSNERALDWESFSPKLGK